MHNKNLLQLNQLAVSKNITEGEGTIDTLPPQSHNRQCQ